MEKEEIKQIAKQVFSEMMASSQYKTADTTFHTHNGIDSPRINQENVVNNNKYVAIAVASSGLVTFNSISNPSALLFYGFAANNAGGGAATLKAMCTGNAQLGVCYSANNSSATTTVTINPSSQSSFIQTSCAIYIDTTSLANTRVAASGTGSDPLTDRFIYVTDGSTVVAEATVVMWDSQSITVNFTLAATWQITGGFLFI